MEYKIYVGTLMKINKGFLKGSLNIMYCGMSNKDTFVLSPYVAKGYQGFSPNIYYNIDSGVIQVLSIEFEVIDVTPEYIIIAE